MRILVATWDGAGNQPPTLALVETLIERGHNLHIIGHDCQRTTFEAAGANFLRYATAPQLDQGTPRTEGDFPTWFIAFNQAAASDVLSIVKQVKPDVCLFDCMLFDSLTAARNAGHKTAALVHGAFSAHAAWAAPIEQAHLALGCSYAAFDRGATFPANLTFVGPLRPALKANSWHRRMKDRPLVVASLSTGLQTKGDQQVKLLQRICDALVPLEIEALVTTGRGISPAELHIGANTTTERSVAHELVLRDAALFLTHAGHGSIMAALRAGTPMLCIPPTADQPHNAALVATLGLGEVLDPKSTPEVIRSAIEHMLADDALKQRVRKFSAEVAFDPQPQKAAELIESLASAN